MLCDSTRHAWLEHGGYVHLPFYVSPNGHLRLTMVDGNLNIDVTPTPVGAYRLSQGDVYDMIEALKTAFPDRRRS